MSRAMILGALAYALALTLSINGSSLWSDEAFSAWLASHESLQRLFDSLIHGDSSDLQMGLYYLYLFFWAKLFGTAEFSLRAANIPFIVLFSFSLIWTSFAIFRSRVIWIVPALLPFIWHYAGEARPYMAILAFGAAALASLVGFIHATGPDSRKFPWICLTCVLAGACFHMLFLLAGPPMALIAFLAWRRNRDDGRWRYWVLPIKALALPFCALAFFLVFTFVRGTAYDYPPPGLRQMASVLYEVSGLSGFGPNRKFSLDFRSYLVPLTIGAACLLPGIFFAFLSGRRAWRERPFLPALAAAACLTVFEAVALSTVLRQQIDVRHLAATVPIFLLLLIAEGSRRSPAAIASLVLLGITWLTADIRLATVPEYQKEDYRNAVAEALSLQKGTGAVIALAADPVGAAYYGLDVQGASPCYPIRQDCGDAFARVPWPREASALEVERWSRSHIDAWMANQKTHGTPVLVIAQRDRAHARSFWWPILTEARSQTTKQVHGFDIDLLIGSDRQPVPR
jgi:hypothetical protein